MPAPKPPITQWPRRVLDWLCSGREDYRAFQRRKARRAYRARRQICLWIWLGAALLMLVCPGAACVLTLLLAATFLSLAVLDEA
jgi:hypothetical protein